jgi:hypothetical protein
MNIRAAVAGEEGDCSSIGLGERLNQWDKRFSWALRNIEALGKPLK